MWGQIGHRAFVVGVVVFIVAQVIVFALVGSCAMGGM